MSVHDSVRGTEKNHDLGQNNFSVFRNSNSELLK